MGIQVGRRRWLVALVVLASLAAVATVGGSGAGDQPSGETVLNDTHERYANADSVVGTADVTVSNGTTTVIATVEFAVADNRSRVVVTRDNATYRAGTNGTVAWYVGPNRTAAWETDALGERVAERPAPGVDDDITDPRVLLDRARRAAENASVEHVRLGEDDDIPAHVIRITHPNESYDGEATLWIARNDSRVLRAEFTDGTNTTTVDFRDTRFDASVHASTFDPPSDRLPVATVDRYRSFGAVQANTTTDLPSLDGAATFREAGVLSRSEGTVVAQRYAVDGANVTVFSTTVDREYDSTDGNVTRVTVDRHPANVTTVRGAAVVYWRLDGVTTAVVTDAGEDRAIELARALDG